MTAAEIHDAVWAARLLVDGKVMIISPETQLAICKALVGADRFLAFEVDRAHTEALELAGWVAQGSNPIDRARALTTRSVSGPVFP